MDQATLSRIKTIVVHDNCPDGMASAILLHDSLPKAEIKFMQHNTDALKALVPEPGYLFCDFVPYVPTKEVEGRKVNDVSAVKPWIDAGTLVLDHHKGVQDVVEAFGPQGRFGDEKTEPGVCGAVLAFRHVWHTFAVEGPDERTWKEAKRAEEFAMLAGVRDTWLNTHPRWHDANVQAEMLRFYPAEHWLGIQHPFRSEGPQMGIWEERRSIGRLLVERQEHSTQKTIEAAYKFTSAKGTKVISFNNLKATSDAAEKLGAEADLIVGFSYLVEGGTPKMLLSTRSHTTFDCLAFAKHNGGGGHTKAAGFNRIIRDDMHPYKMIENLVNWFESSR